MFNTVTLKNNKTYRLRDFYRINSNEDSYLIGYLLGDGSWLKDKKQMSVTSVDKYIMEYFRDRYQPDYNISSRIPVNNTH